MKFSAADFGYKFLASRDEDGHGAENEEIIVSVDPERGETVGGTRSNDGSVDNPRFRASPKVHDSKFTFSKNEMEFDLFKTDAESDENIGFRKGKGKIKNPAAAGALSSCCCCCMLLICTLIPGIALVLVADNDELHSNSNTDLSKYYVVGIVLLLSSLLFFLCASMFCCISFIAACTGNGSNDDESGFMSWSGGGKDNEELSFTLKRLNDRFDDEKEQLDDIRLDLTKNVKEAKDMSKRIKDEKQRLEKQRKREIEQQIKQELQLNTSPDLIKRKIRPICFKIVFQGDVQVSTIHELTQQISLVIKLGTKDVDTVAMVITSPGGSAHMYGLAASQMIRIKNAGLKLVVCVDSVAASGGYMMASVADEIYAAPFAIVGSIGVISVIPNIDKLLRQNKIETYVLTAGKYKSTMNVVGEITAEGKAKYKEELEKLHVVFKEHIVLNRPKLREVIDDLATGEAFNAIEAKKLDLVDHISTSDEYFEQMAETHDIMLVKEKKQKPSFGTLFGELSSQLMNPSSGIQRALSGAYSLASNRQQINF